MALSALIKRKEEGGGYYSSEISRIGEETEELWRFENDNICIDIYKKTTKTICISTLA
jgi:hypothetical protein